MNLRVSQKKVMLKAIALNDHTIVTTDIYTSLRSHLEYCLNVNLYSYLSNFAISNFLTLFMRGGGKCRKKGRKEMLYLTTHSIHFIYGYMSSVIW